MRPLTRPWDKEELAWAAECVSAGDTAEDIAEMAGRTVEDVKANVRCLSRLTDKQRQVRALYTAGTTVRDIGRIMKPDTPRPDSLGAVYVRRLRAKGYHLPSRIPGRSPDQEAPRYG